MVAHVNDSTGETPQNTHAVHEDGNGITICDWTIRSHQSSIADSGSEEALSSTLGIKLPGMLFDKSYLQINFGDQERGLQIEFSASNALKMVGDADPSIRVKAAERWAGKNQRSDVEIGVIEGASDWTFSTRYPGTVYLEGSPVENLNVEWRPGSSDTSVGIDYDMVKDTTIPILFSSQVILFEDELDDNGIASFKVRIRVMPSFFFILARFFLRVDGVLVRLFDTRLFHQFGTNVLVRECITKEGRLDTTLRHLHPSLIRDADLAAQRVPVISSCIDNISVPS